MAQELEEKIKKAKVLVIEDDEMLVKFLKDELQEAGISSVETAVYGKEALEKIKKKKPDLILLDLILPRMDGFEFLEIIRNNEKTKDIPIIIMTNLTHGEDKRKAFQLGVDDYLVKSECDPEEIIERVVRVLRKHLN